MLFLIGTLPLESTPVLFPTSVAFTIAALAPEATAIPGEAAVADHQVGQVDRAGARRDGDAGVGPEHRGLVEAQAPSRVRGAEADADRKAGRVDDRRGQPRPLQADARADAEGLGDRVGPGAEGDDVARQRVGDGRAQVRGRRSVDRDRARRRYRERLGADQGE